MKLMQLSTYAGIICFFISLSALSQDRTVVNDTLKSESVIIVKSYNPTINDAFKIQDAPSFVDPNKEKKQQPNYRIHSVPVASTFVPKKAKAIEVEEQEQEKGFSNYARLAAGNFTNVEAEAFVVIPIDKKSQFTTHINHQSSQGGINDVLLDDSFYDTSLKLGFDRFEKKRQFNGLLEVKHQLYNWYGLSTDSGLSQTQINQIDPAHSFVDINFKGKLHLDTDNFDGGTVLLRHFRDDFEGSENHFALSPEFKFVTRGKGEDLEIKIPTRIEFLQNTFKNDLSDIEQSVFIGGLTPNISLVIEGIDINVGVGAFFATNKLAEENKFYVYPKLLANYKLFKYDFNVFARISGGLDQNTYRSASQENLFVAPQLVTAPTNRTYDAKLGINGSFLNFLGFEAYVNIKNEEDFAFFLPSVNLSSATDEVQAFEYGNAFEYDYGDLKTTAFHGNLQFDIDKTYGVGLEFDIANFSISKQQEAWYLPQLQTAIKGYYIFDKQWKASGKLYYTGERKALNPINQATESLKSYVDLNLQVDYQINKHWSAFIKGKNLANQKYERWLNYPVQTAQGLIGVRYDFDINK